ncbi:OLC1v1012001C1 [Oldenlandia corymbosa var. corymbosa]|uniref:OLC1v1012001C1 n=1 Tax=Oldenlandia corymbosa var. corymbosa TaxID=529605 RepID=A0AAV1DUZ5_OLDCO|nr:OLC1v1012001C1 [Oldenlandia corymbosa var. corymbosa]
MALAREAAEKGDLSGAASIVEDCQKKLSESVSAKANDVLNGALVAELNGMRERMASRVRYEKSGRAMLCSGMDSHLRQRPGATWLELFMPIKPQNWQAWLLGLELHARGARPNLLLPRL